MSKITADDFRRMILLRTIHEYTETITDPASQEFVRVCKFCGTKRSEGHKSYCPWTFVDRGSKLTPQEAHEILQGSQEVLQKIVDEMKKENNND